MLRRLMDPLPRNRSRYRYLGGKGWRGPLLRVRRNAHQRRLRSTGRRLPRYWILALCAAALAVWGAMLTDDARDVAWLAVVGVGYWLARRRSRRIEQRTPATAPRAKARPKPKRRARRQSTREEVGVALATATLILGFYVWQLDGLQSSGLTTALLLINSAVVVAICSSKLPRAEKVYWSIVPALGLIPHIPFL